ISEAVIARVNRTSALWQMFGSLCDVIVIMSDGSAHYYEEVPMDHVGAGFPAGQHFTISLEYGPDHDCIDPFDISVARVAQDDPLHSHDARYLHPVVRFHRQGQKQAEHHVAENLENEWNGPMHRAPLKAFLAEALKGTAESSPPGAVIPEQSHAAALLTRA
ncbi:MAG TPA: hypothetical protein VKE49_11090, partial [Myxococcaceae bacterium]|nr:hypothetical protein [Myxococcaceae bacterium]